MTNRDSENDLNAEPLTSQSDVLGDTSPVTARVNLNNDARDVGNCAESTAVVPCGEQNQIQLASPTDSGAQANFHDQSTTWRLKALKEVDDNVRERARLQIDTVLEASEANLSIEPPAKKKDHHAPVPVHSNEPLVQTVDLNNGRGKVINASGNGITERELPASTRAKKSETGSTKEIVFPNEVNQTASRQQIEVSAPGLAPKEFKTSPNGEVTQVLYNDGSQLVRQEVVEGGQYKWRATSAEGVDLVARSFRGNVTSANAGALHIEQTWPVPQTAVYQPNGDYIHSYKNGAVNSWDGQRNTNTVHYPDGNVRVLQYAPDQSGKLQVTEYADKKAGTVTHVNENYRTEPLSARYSEALASARPSLERLSAPVVRTPDKVPATDKGLMISLNSPVVPIPEKTKVVAQPDPTSGWVRPAFNNSLALQREAELNAARDQPAGPKAKPAEIVEPALQPAKANTVTAPDMVATVAGKDRLTASLEPSGSVIPIGDRISSRPDVQTPGYAPKQVLYNGEQPKEVVYNDGSRLVLQPGGTAQSGNWKAYSAQGTEITARSFQGSVQEDKGGALHISQIYPVPQTTVQTQDGRLVHEYKGGASQVWNPQDKTQTMYYPDGNVRVLQYASDQTGKLQVSQYADKKAGTVTYVSENNRTEPLNGRYTEALASSKPSIESLGAPVVRTPDKLPTADKGLMVSLNNPVVPIPEKTKVVAQPEPTSGWTRPAFNNSQALLREADLNPPVQLPAGPKAKPGEIVGPSLPPQKTVTQPFGEQGLSQPAANVQRREAPNLYGGGTADAGNQLLAGVKTNAPDAGLKSASLSPYAQPQRVGTDPGGVNEIVHNNGERWVRQPMTGNGQQPSWKVFSANGVELANQNFRGTVTQDASGALRVDKTYPVPQRSFQGTDGTYAQEYKNGASVVWNPQDRTQTVFYPTGNTRVLQYEVDPASGKLKVASYADKAAGTVTYVNQGNRVEPLNGKFSEALAATKPNFDRPGAPVVFTNQSRPSVAKAALDTPLVTPLVSRQAITEPVVPVKGGQGLNQPGRTVDGPQGPLRVPATDGLLPAKPPLADGVLKHVPADTKLSGTSQPLADHSTLANRKAAGVDPRLDATAQADRIVRSTINNPGEVNPLARGNTLAPQADKLTTDLRVKPEGQRSFAPDSRLNLDTITSTRLARTITTEPSVTQSFRPQPGFNPDRLPRNTGRGFDQVASLLTGAKPANTDKSGNLPRTRDIRENTLLPDRTKTDSHAPRQNSLTAASLNAANQQSLRTTERANQLAALQITRDNQDKRLSASNDNNQARLPGKNLSSSELPRIASEKILTGKISRDRFAEPGFLAGRQSAEFRDWLSRRNANVSDQNSKFVRSIDLRNSNTSLIVADRQTRQVLIDRIAVLRNNRDERAGLSQLQSILPDGRNQKEGSRVVAFDPSAAAKDAGGRRTAMSDGKGDRAAGFDGSRRADWRIFEPGRPNIEAVRLENFRVLKLDGRVSCPRHFPTVAECMILGTLLASGIARRQQRQQFISQLGTQVSDASSSKPGRPGQKFDVKSDNGSVNDGTKPSAIKGGRPGQRMEGRTDAVVVNDGSKFSGKFEPRTVKIGSGDKAVTMTNDGRTISVSAAGKTFIIGTDGRFTAIDQRPTGADNFTAGKFTQRSLRIGGCDRKFPTGAEFALLTAVCGIAKWRRNAEGKYPSELTAGQNKTIERFNAIMSKHGIKPNWDGVRDNRPVSLRVTASVEELTRLKEQKSAKIAENADSRERGRNRRWFGKTEIAVSALMLIAAAARMRSDIGNPNSQHFYPEPIITIERTLRRPERKDPEQNYLRDEPPAVRPKGPVVEQLDKFGQAEAGEDDLNRKEEQVEPASIAAVLTNLNRAVGDGDFVEDGDPDESDPEEVRRQRGSLSNGKKVKNASQNDTAGEESETGAKQPARALYRKTWLVAPGDTLVAIAEREYKDVNLGWLIADLNFDRVKETWLDGKRIIEVNARTRLNLPTEDEIRAFYANPKPEADPDNLVTITVQQHLDQELVESQLAIAMTLTKKPSAPKPVKNKDLQVPAAPKHRKETTDILRELMLEETGEVDLPEINWTEHAS